MRDNSSRALGIDVLHPNTIVQTLTDHPNFKVSNSIKSREVYPTVETYRDNFCKAYKFVRTYFESHILSCNSTNRFTLFLKKTI